MRRPLLAITLAAALIVVGWWLLRISAPAGEAAGEVARAASPNTDAMPPLAEGTTAGEDAPDMAPAAAVDPDGRATTEGGWLDAAANAPREADSADSRPGASPMEREVAPPAESAEAETRPARRAPPRSTVASRRSVGTSPPAARSRSGGSQGGATETGAIAPGVSGPMLPKEQGLGDAASRTPLDGDPARPEELADAAPSAPDRRDQAPEAAEQEDADEDATSAEETPRPASLWLSPSRAVLAVGETLDIVVQLDGGDGLASAPFHLTFDPSVLAFRSATEGPLLRRDGAATAFMAATSSAGDRVVVGLSRLGSAGGVSGGGVLCVLRFEAIGPGSSPLVFERARLLRADGDSQAIDADGGEIVVR